MTWWQRKQSRGLTPSCFSSPGPRPPSQLSTFKLNTKECKVFRYIVNLKHHSLVYAIFTFNRNSLCWSLVTRITDFKTVKSMHLGTCNDTVADHVAPTVQYIHIQGSRTLDSVTWILSPASRLHDWVGALLLKLLRPSHYSVLIFPLLHMFLMNPRNE